MNNIVEFTPAKTRVVVEQEASVTITLSLEQANYFQAFVGRSQNGLLGIDLYTKLKNGLLKAGVTPFILKDEIPCFRKGDFV